MGLGHEKLNVYQFSINYVEWVYEKSAELNGIHRPARDQWLRASIELDRIAIMLSRLGGRGYCVKEDSVEYGCAESDLDFDGSEILT